MAEWEAIVKRFIWVPSSKQKKHHYILMSDVTDALVPFLSATASTEQQHQQLLLKDCKQDVHYSLVWTDETDKIKGILLLLSSLTLL